MRKYKLMTNRKYGIYILTFALIVSTAGIIHSKSVGADDVKINNTNAFKYIEIQKQIRQTRQRLDIKEFEITAYDLSRYSCGKLKSNPAYGISRGGFNLRGHTWETARVIAVDPNVIPLGTKVLIEFKDKKHMKYNGVYIAYDTGNAIKGNKIDVFIEDLGDSKRSKEAIEFGVTKAKVRIVE